MNATSQAIKDMKYDYVGLFPFWFNQKLLRFLKAIFSIFFVIWKQFLKLPGKILFQYSLWFVYFLIQSKAIAFPKNNFFLYSLLFENNFLS